MCQHVMLIKTLYLTNANITNAGIQTRKLLYQQLKGYVISAAKASLIS